LLGKSGILPPLLGACAFKFCVDTPGFAFAIALTCVEGIIPYPRPLWT
jgi:hypothetical protein